MTKQQKYLKEIEGTTMPTKPISLKDEWTKKLVKEVSGKMVKVGYMDDCAPIIGVAYAFDDDMVSFVDISTGETDSIDSPTQVYWARPIKFAESTPISLKEYTRK